MDTRQAYDIWASQYDTNENKTRDLEALALRNALEEIPFVSCLEVGCGTGKNTEWLMKKARLVLAIDLSEEMILRAKEKITSERVQFKQADITKKWNFTDDLYDLVSFSLVLEHIENLDLIFNEVSMCLNPGGHVYIGELHPFKQYSGTKARFDAEDGRHVLECYNHHLSDFIRAARKYGLVLVDIDEYFDDNDRHSIPRILTILLRNS